MMGGEVGFASRLGHGSCFWFDLPLVEAPAPAPAETVARASRLLTATGERPCVLVVDDNATNRLVARSLLDRLGCRTDLAGDGAEAIEAAGRERFDLILMDISMPVMDGIEATRRLRAQGLATPIVALTASAGFADAEKFIAAGTNDCLLKPVSADALANTLARPPMRSRAPPPRWEPRPSAAVPPPSSSPPGSPRRSCPRAWTFRISWRRRCGRWRRPARPWHRPEPGRRPSENRGRRARTG